MGLVLHGWLWHFERHSLDASSKPSKAGNSLMDFDSVKRILFASAVIALPFVMFLGVMELIK